MPQQLSTNTFTTAKWIVSPNASDGTHTTITAAIASASAGDTIIIRPGTYTESPILKAGVNLVAYSTIGGQYSIGVGNVIINGKSTFTGVGNVTITGITLQTNSDFCLSVSGNSASVVYLNNCFINALNNTAIQFSSSSASASIYLNYCQGNLATATGACFVFSSPGVLEMNWCEIDNIGTLNTTASTVSGGGAFQPNFCKLWFPISMSSTSSMFVKFTDFTTTASPIIATTGTSSAFFFNCNFIANSAANCINIGAGTAVSLFRCFFNSSATYPITGTGSLTFTEIEFNSVGAIDPGLTISNSAAHTWISAGGVGTSGQVFTSNGPTSPPTWQGASAGFLAYLTVTASNVTGDGTEYQVIQDTKSFDIGTNFNAATGVFTAPVTGNYHFDAGVYFQGSSGILNGITLVATSISLGNNLNFITAQQTGLTISGLIPMTAGDTCKVNAVQGGGAKTTSIVDNSGFSTGHMTYFSGYLI